MLALLVAVVAGILLADHYVFPLWCVVVGIIMFIINAVVLPRGGWRVVCLFGTVLLTSAAIYELNTTSLDRSYRLYEIEIERITSSTERHTFGECRIIGVMYEDSMQSCRATARFTADSTFRVRSGDRLMAYCSVRPFNRDSENSYERYMSRRGMVGSLWLNGERVISRDTSRLGLVARFRDTAEQRIERLSLSEDVEAVVKAVAIGHTESLSRSMRDSYRRSGASHLLAVSGLHVGFVCVIAGVLLGLLLLLSHGQILRSVVVVALIWLYAAVVGFTPSIVRAALMFSLLQLTIAFASRILSLNTLCFAAVVMLWWDPHQMWDAGFLLSCLAVAAIVEWGVPIIGLLKRYIRSEKRHSRQSLLRIGFERMLEWLASAVVVSVVATAATMPLTAHLFGLSSLWAIIMSPLMVLLCAITVGATIFWIIFPVTMLQPAAGWVIECATSVMNNVAAWCAAKPTLIFEERISGAMCIAIYLVYIIITLVRWARR